ncbi:hypothetical protein HMPREF1077_00751 [Parabacteroides johnsonii CL02T12C29]|uniref:BACON domain-containing protein n=2 Tax=Parabacteroides johnsonii TaxID=387661 RepID=K5ZCS2_9BACT|nr:hypothetical protein HMPREF1077_00751 [Parabacteroides johnsonii CL02T12C29]
MKVFCSLLSLFLFVASAFSQDCNGTYEGGLALLKKRTEASVKEAVRKFESAKRCYKVNRDQQGVLNCDEQITACKQILNYFTQQTAKVTAEESYEFPEAGGEQIIPVKTKRSWSFSDVHDWCTATKEKDGLKIVVNPNRTTVRRSQTITLKWSGRKQLVKIVQEGAEEKLTLSESDLFFQADDTEKVIEITSNCDWAVESNDAPWCSWRKDSLHLYVEPSINEGSARRTGTIRIGAGSRHAEIRLMQEMDNFRIFTPDENDTLVFIPKGGTVDLPVEYTVSQNETPWEIYSYPNWCTATREGNASLTLKCLSNKMKEDRDGTIFVKKGRKLISITVIQLGKGSKYMTFQPLFGKKKKAKSLYQRAVLFTPEED